MPLSAIFTIAGSRLVLSSKIEFFETVVKGFQLEIIVRKSSILDVGGNSNPPLITIFGKVNFPLTQATVI